MKVSMVKIQPKYLETVKAEWKVSKRSKEIISEYSKFTRYDEDEIIDMVITGILEDTDFIDWLKKKRYKRKLYDLDILGSEDESDSEE